MIALGALVRFREDTPQHAKNEGIVFVVVASPSGESVSMDRTHGDERPYLWLVVAADVDLAPSRQRRRTAYVTNLEEVSA